MKEIFLGIDVGSTSIKCVLLDEEGRIISSVYLRNKGITESLVEALEGLAKGIKADTGTGAGRGIKIAACGITGSGRNFASLLVGADIVRTEVLAHTVAALSFYPEARTIFEIGGEDCKLMIVEDGILADFSMNSICAGGTGAMIEAIANRMGIPIEEVGEMALKSRNQLDLPGKCGIFCQSAVVSKLNTGADKCDILMGVCRALIRNYLTICKSGRLKPPYIFQGATALNKALVRALEEEIQHEVIVPSECALMGAIGIAQMAMEEMPEKTKFKGLEAVVRARFDISNFRCQDCANRCEVIQIVQDGRLAGSIGSRCHKSFGDVILCP
ncbi:MAG: acyl-CoA dehydratase activase [Acidobacteriota bacterium]|nr:acyl-CoA dehydratase activase [Acidobacteriota bacterium]